jgi:RNA-binding protein 26
MANTSSQIELPPSTEQGNGFMASSSNGSGELGQYPSSRGFMRGRGRGGFRGSSRGRGGHGATPYSRPTNDTIVVDNIPKEYCTLDNINEYFKKFGVITNIQMQPRFNKAIVSYQTPQEAQKAWSSPDVIFSNRFVKVYFLQSAGDNTADRSEVAKTNELGSPAVQPSGVPSPNVANPIEKPQTPTAPITPAIPKAEEKRKQMMTMMELQKQKEQLIQKQIEYQKELMDKLSKKDLSAKDRAELLNALKATEKATREALSSAVATTATVKAVVPTKPLTPEEREKERLDRELDAISKLAATGDDVDPALKAQLESLKAEVVYFR